MDGTLATGIGDIKYDLFYNYGETSNEVHGLNRRLVDNFVAAIDAVRNSDGQIVCRDTSIAGCVPFNPFGRTNSRAAIDFSFTTIEISTG